MMRPFKDQPIAKKAFTLSMVPTICALIVVVVASLASTFVQVRDNLLKDLDTQAAILADDIATALEAHDVTTATDTLRILRARPNVDAACLYDSTGALFASYGAGQDPCAPPKNAAARHVSPAVRRTIALGPRTVGEVEVRGNYVNLLTWMRRQAAVALGALVAGLTIAVLLTRRLRADITTPVIDLARMADLVSTSGDYSARATKTSGDEVGDLVQSFNDMLDVVERKEHELGVLLRRTEAASQAKDEFLASVSHELRTPLNAILGWLQILRTTSPTEATVAKALSSLERNARAQARLIEDLIEVSRVAAGKVQLRTEVVDLKSVIEAAADVIGPGASAKSIRLFFDVPTEPLLVSGDRDRLHQVVWNLLSNAVKFTPAGGTVSVTVAVTDRAYALSVRDTGIGIAAGFLPHVFERFKQADGSMTREQGGLGLGLAIVKELTELHGGTVEAFSDGRGQGSVFTVRIPKRVFIPSAERPGLMPRSASQEPLTGLRLLAVDDDADALEIVATALAAEGARVTTVREANQAVEAWRKGEFDVLLCDLAMPETDGFAVLDHIREFNVRAGRPTVAIALTAYASPSERRKSAAAGFSAHVAKPYEVGELIATITRAVEPAAPS